VLRLWMVERECECIEEEIGGGNHTLYTKEIWTYSYDGSCGYAAVITYMCCHNTACPLAMVLSRRVLG
jgi:hypothetical protein